MPVFYPLHLRERFERMQRQRIAELERVKASAARHLAKLLAPPLAPILVPAAGYLSRGVVPQNPYEDRRRVEATPRKVIKYQSR
jgi:hypothetical protein